MGPPNQQKGDSTAALTIEKSSHIRLTGTGQEQKCGAPYPSSLQQCGIRITGGWWGLMGRENSNMEIDHVEFYQTGGPGFKPNKPIDQAWTEFDSYYHHNYAHDTGTEGFYIGANYADGSPVFRGLEISYNRIEHTNWSGMDVKGGRERIKVHHNIIIATSQTLTDGGIGIVDTLEGDFYNNWTGLREKLELC